MTFVLELSVAEPVLELELALKDDAVVVFRAQCREQLEGDYEAPVVFTSQRLASMYKSRTA